MLSPHPLPLQGPNAFRGNCHERRTVLKTKQLTTDAILAAMCAVLGMISLDFGNLKITFESLPIIIGALLFGPIDGFAIGGIGALVYQLLRYGISVTTVLWILPYALCGLVVGAYAKKNGFELSQKKLCFIIVASELMVTLLNTGVMYIDSKIYGYYVFAYIFGTFIIRIVISIAKALVFTAVLSSLMKPIKNAIK